MKVDVEIFPWLSQRLGGADEGAGTLTWQVEVAEESTVGDLMTELALAHAEFRRHAFDPESRTLSDELVVVLNGRLLTLVGGLDARLHEGDRLAVIQALAGG